jgi:hypothetical protein
MRRERLPRLIIMLVLGALVLGAQSVSAQLRIVGAISGTVQDPTGAVVPKAKVVLKDTKTGLTKEIVSTEIGTFLFSDLAIGSYEVTVTAQGFKSETLNNISVSTSQTTDVRVSLELGATSETVLITGGESQTLEATSELVASTLGSTTLNQLPLGNRGNALALARLAPGAQPPTSGDTRYNNLPGGAVNVTVDGINDASNGFKSGGTVFFMTVPVRLGALEEVSVETGGLGADSGAQSGANIKFTTKRGGNQYHGSFFYEPQSERFNANSWSRNAQGLSRALNRTQNYGGNIGGPLVPFGTWKEKLFFFADFEKAYSPLTTPRTIKVLTPAAQAGIYTYVVNGTTNQLRTVNVLSLASAKGAPTALDPVAEAIIAINNKIPAGAAKVPSTDLNRDTYTWNAENNNYAYFPATRVDYFPTPKEQVTFAWQLRHNWQAGERRLPVPDISRTNPFRLTYFIWSVALQSTFTPHLLNEVRYGVQHSGDSNASSAYGSYFTFNGKPLRIGQTLPFTDGASNTALGAPAGGLGVPFIDQQNTTGRHFITTIYDTLTLTRGQHTFTIGASFRRTDWKDTGEVFPVPTYALGTPSGDPLPSTLFNTTTLPGINPTLLGDPEALYNTLTGRVASSSFTKVVNPDTLNYDGFINFTWTRSLMGGTYIQDRWRIKPSLTLNFGLRWEVQGPMYDVKGITAAPDVASILGPSTKEFAPGALSGNNNPTVKVGVTPYHTDWLNFPPNVGFAWNPTRTEGLLGKLLGGSKTVIRGSYGIVVYDEGTQFFAANLGPNAGKTINATTLIPGQGGLPSFYTLSNVVANPLTISSFTFPTTTYKPVINQADQTFARTIAAFDPNLRTPYSVNYNFGIQREFGKNNVLEVRYVGNQSHRVWRTSNLNEVNIIENGFLQEFKNAQKNLAINQAAGINSFANLGRTGQVALPIFDAAFGPRGGVGAIATGSGYGSAAFIANLQNGEAGALANTLAVNQNYVCRMFGSAFSPCTRINPLYNAAGPYPINFFVFNPYVIGTTGVGARLPLVDNGGWDSYNGLQIQFRQRLSHGLNWTTNYTWSKSLTNLSVDNQNQSLDYTTLRNPKLDRRVSPFDIRHVFQAAGTYDLPFGRGRWLSIDNRILDAVAGGWTLGSIFVFQTGAPIQLTGGFQTVNNTNNPEQNGVILAPGVTLDMIQQMFNHDLTRLTGRVGTTDLQRLAVDPRLIGPDGRANPAFLLPNTTPGSFGELLFLRDRNTFQFDVSMIKTFQVKERARLQVYAAFNNVLNHPRWGFPNANVFSTTFGVVGAPAGSRSINLRATASF